MITRKVKALALASVMLLALVPINFIEAGAVETATSTKANTVKEQVSSTKTAEKDGWQQSNNLWYFYKDGKMQTGWIQDGANWYYMNQNGTMYMGWLQDGSNWFYLKGNGVMAYSTFIDGYYLGGNGAYIPSSGGKIYTGKSIVPNLLKLGFFFNAGHGESTNDWQLSLREGGQAMNYTHNKITFAASPAKTTDNLGSDFIIQRCKDNVECNSLLNQIMQLAMPDYYTELRALVDGPDKTINLGGRTISKQTFASGVVLKFSSISQ